MELHYYDVSAPVDGIVGDIPVRVGDRVTVSTLLTTVDLPGALEAYIYVPAGPGETTSSGCRYDSWMRTATRCPTRISRLYRRKSRRTRKPCWRKPRWPMRTTSCVLRSK